MSDNLALAVLFACALSCSLTVVLFDEIVLPAIKALRARLQPSDDPFSDTPHGDWPHIPTNDFKTVFHDNGGK